MAGVYIPGGNGVQPWKSAYNTSGTPTILWDSGAYGELGKLQFACCSLTLALEKQLQHKRRPHHSVGLGRIR